MIATPPKTHSSDSFAVRAKRFSIEEYHILIESGALTTEHSLELLEGLLVEKMPIYPPHRFATDEVRKLLQKLLTDVYFVTGQQPITLDESEPEPDCFVAKGKSRDYINRHPTSEEILLVVEVSDSTLKSDRFDKTRIYARAGIAVYWIVNLVDRQIEVYTHPLSAAETPLYKTQTIYLPEDQVPVELDGKTAGQISVADVLP